MADLAPSAPARAGQLVLVLPDGARLPIEQTMTLGRGDDATVKLNDRTVSRLHARIVAADGGATIEDAGSRFGVFVSGEQLSAPRRLQPGMEIRLGNVTLSVESAAPPPVAQAAPVAAAPVAAPAPGEPAAPAPDPNATIVVPIGATGQGLRAVPAAPQDGSLRPRVRSGWKLKRVVDDPEHSSYVLHDLRGGQFVRMDEVDARLFELMDGRRTISELLIEATRLLGPTGPGRLARVIADFGDRGMLDGVAPTPSTEPEPGALKRAFAPRDKVFPWLAGYFPRAYRHWGRFFFSALSVTGLVLLSLAGIIIFSYLVGARYGTPLVVAHRLFVGGLVFMVGRFVIVIYHELAHGMALTHFGRRTERAGARIVLVFPYAFVDTSEAYFEPRAHRIWISAAGPMTDFALAAVFSIGCAIAPRGSFRDILFQLAFAGYVGAFFNANPFLDRDGYQILSDWLREPRLRQRARAQLSARLSGAARADEGSPVLARYAIAGLVWSLIGAGFMIAISLRYYDILVKFAPRGFVVGLFIAFFLTLVLPVVVALGVPMVRRARFGTAEVNRVLR